MANSSASSVDRERRQSSGSDQGVDVDCLYDLWA